MRSLGDHLARWARSGAAGVTLSACVAHAPDNASPVPDGVREAASRATGAPAPSPAATPASEWLVAPVVDLRKLTVLVRVAAPEELAAKYRELAKRYKKLEPLFLAAADGAFGSGSLVVRREARGSERRAFVVTNRHVVALSSRVSVVFGGLPAPIDASVLYVDPHSDLAVLSLERRDGGRDSELERVLAAGGFELERSPARDQQLVVASGYPGIGKDPSYQVTRGYVSNERFELEEGAARELYVQHTAPIDPGSSGGPLTTDGGRLLGVNTLKVRRRDNVGLAIPASVIAEAVERAAAMRPAPEPPPANALSDCGALAEALARGEAELRAIERAVGAQLVASEGMASLEYLIRSQPDWLEAFAEDPTSTFVRAVALRLERAARGRAQARAGEAASGCVPIDDAEQRRSARFRVRTPGGEHTWAFGYEQERWKLTSATFGSARGNTAFFDAIDSSKARKKWKPTLR